MADTDRDTEGAWQRAKADTVAIYRTWEFGIAVTILTLIAVPLAVVFTSADASTQTQVAVPILAGAVAVALALLCVLAIQVVTAPYRQRNEARGQVASKGPVEVAPDVELNVRNYARVGDDLYTKMTQGMGWLPSDEQEAGSWADDVVRFLSEYGSPEDAKAFVAASDGQADVRDRLRARVNKLGEIAQRYGS